MLPTSQMRNTSRAGSAEDWASRCLPLGKLMTIQQRAIGSSQEPI